jgi:hypothetical protein
MTAAPPRRSRFRPAPRPRRTTHGTGPQPATAGQPRNIFPPDGGPQASDDCNATARGMRSRVPGCRRGVRFRGWCYGITLLRLDGSVLLILTRSACGRPDPDLAGRPRVRLRGRRPRTRPPDAAGRRPQRTRPGRPRRRRRPRLRPPGREKMAARLPRLPPLPGASRRVPLVAGAEQRGCGSVMGRSITVRQP